MMTGDAENHDEHVYSWIPFERETVDFMLRAMDFYISLLDEEAKELEKDPDLAQLITTNTRREIGLGRDQVQATRLKAWVEQQLRESEDSYDCELSLTHRSVRFLKSVCLVYLAQLKVRRNVLAARPNISAVTLSALDREVSRKEELFEAGGVFKNATLVPLLAPQRESSGQRDEQLSEKEPSLLDVSRPRPIFVDSIEILDGELRTRCLDLFNKFQESGQSERNDTVVSEASRILENRLRMMAGSKDGENARSLVTRAFNGRSARLRVSDVPAEQEAAQLLFLGVFGFIRNQVQHKLLANVPAERALQILGLIDYLLSVIEQAEKISEIPTSEDE